MPFSQYKKDLISYGIWRPVAEILSNPAWPSQKEWHAAAHANLTGRTLTTVTNPAILADDGTTITYSSDIPGTVAIQSDVISGWTGNHTLMIYQSGIGDCKFVGGDGVLVRNASSSTFQYGFLIARRVNTNEWVVV